MLMRETLVFCVIYSIRYCFSLFDVDVFVVAVRVFFSLPSLPPGGFFYVGDARCANAAEVESD